MLTLDKIVGLGYIPLLYDSIKSTMCRKLKSETWYKLLNKIRFSKQDSHIEINKSDAERTGNSLKFQFVVFHCFVFKYLNCYSIATIQTKLKIKQETRNPFMPRLFLWKYSHSQYVFNLCMIMTAGVYLHM